MSCMDDDDNTTTSRVLENAYYDDSVCILRLVEYIMHIALANMYVCRFLPLHRQVLASTMNTLNELVPWY